MRKHLVVHTLSGLLLKFSKSLTHDALAFADFAALFALTLDAARHVASSSSAVMKAAFIVRVERTSLLPPRCMTVKA